jgi:hypothetical protein
MTIHHPTLLFLLILVFLISIRNMVKVQAYRTFLGERFYLPRLTNLFKLGYLVLALTSLTVASWIEGWVRFE